MKNRLLKSLTGKYVSKTYHSKFCHIDKILVIEGNKAIATAVIETQNERILHLILEVSWVTDSFGIHKITNCEILKEDEIDGNAEYPKKD